MSKGSDPRPKQVSTKEFNSNWDKAFGNIKQSETKSTIVKSVEHVEWVNNLSDLPNLLKDQAK